MSLAASYSIAAVFTAKDRLSPAIRSIEKRYGSFAGNVGRTLGKLDRGINKVLKVGATAALAGIVAGTIAATREFIKFDQAVVGANVRFKDFVAGSEQSEKTLQKLKDAAREVGKTTQFTATEAAQGLNFYAKAGFSSAEAMAVLEDTVNLATVAEADFNRTADISSDLLGALGLNAQDSATKIQNLKDVNRALGITANSANVDLEDLFETLKVAAPVATAAGEGMHELMAITGALGGAGIKGSMGATALKNAYIRLAAPTNKITAALDKLGLKQKDFIDANGDMKSMVTIMQMLGDASAGLGKAEQLGIFAEIFGKNAVAGAANLSKSLSQVEEIMVKLESKTKLKDLADEIRKGLGMQVNILKSGLIELGFKFVEAFEKDGRGALENIIKAVQNFDMKPIQKAVTNFIGTIKKVNEFVQKIGGWSTVAKIIIGFAIAVKVLTAAMFIMNIAALPITGIVWLIAAAIAALIAVVILLKNNWDKITDAVKRAWGWFNKMLDNPLIATAALIFAPLIAVPALIIKYWTPIKEFFQNLWDTVKPIIDAVGGFFGGNIKGLPDSEKTKKATEEAKARVNFGYAPNAAKQESVQARLMRGRGTITVKSEDGTPLEVDNGNMNDTGWDMQTLGRDGAN